MLHFRVAAQAAGVRNGTPLAPMVFCPDQGAAGTVLPGETTRTKLWVSERGFPGAARIDPSATDSDTLRAVRCRFLQPRTSLQ
jgi:hypothetical protein